MSLSPGRSSALLNPAPERGTGDRAGPALSAALCLSSLGNLSLVYLFRAEFIAMNRLVQSRRIISKKTVIQEQKKYAPSILGTWKS